MHTGSAQAPGNPRAPFDEEFYIILNAAVGGNYTGCTSPGCITASLPQEYLVDYVRVYQDIVNSGPTVVITSPGTGATLPAGDITSVGFSRDEEHMAFYLSGSRFPRDLFVYDFGGGEPERLTNTLNPNIDSYDLVEGEVVRIQNGEVAVNLTSQRIPFSVILSEQRALLRHYVKA